MFISVYILWHGEKIVFRGLLKLFFKQYVFLSEKGNDSCEQQLKENLTCQENTVVTCTPLIGRTDFQVNNAVQEPNFYSTPIAVKLRPPGTMFSVIVRQ